MSDFNMNNALIDFAYELGAAVQAFEEADDDEHKINVDLLAEIPKSYEERKKFETEIKRIVRWQTGNKHTFTVDVDFVDRVVHLTNLTQSASDYESDKSDAEEDDKKCQCSCAKRAKTG